MASYLLWGLSTTSKKNTDLYPSFKEGDFIVYHTTRKGCAVPMDPALENAYNKVAKGQSSIIGFSRRKQAVAKQNIIKHEKANLTSFLWNLCELGKWVIKF